MSEVRLSEALGEIGKHEELRRRFAALVLEAESSLARRDYNVREEVTGPLIDALHSLVPTVCVSLEDGTRFEVPYRSKIARDLSMRSVERPDHIFEPQTTKLLLHVTASARHVVIGGAYAGDHAILVARQIAEGGGIVHAFEPNPEQMHWLRHNAEINGVANVRFNLCALWDRSDVRLKLVGDDAYIRAEPTTDGEGLPVTTIAEYAAEHDIDRIDAIMLDIEGGELAALRGAGPFLAEGPESAPAVIYEVNNAYVDWSDGLHLADVVAFLTGNGYESFGIRDYQSNVDMREHPVELVPVEGAYVGGPRHGFNVFATKRRELLKDPLIRVTPGLSPKLLHHRDPALHAPGSATGRER
jgi:FkbM family methyltransferase